MCRIGVELYVMSITLALVRAAIQTDLCWATFFVVVLVDSDASPIQPRLTVLHLKGGVVLPDKVA